MKLGKSGAMCRQRYRDPATGQLRFVDGNNNAVQDPGEPGLANATLKLTGEDEFELRFDEPQTAITPGQAAVVYDGDIVLGGGWIESRL